jgi:IrrE N-terminal-like domain
VARLLPYSKNRMSRLIRSFIERAGGPGATADDAMRGVVTTLRGRANLQAHAIELDVFLKKRRILETRVAPGLTADGYVEPLGAEFESGFRIVLRAGTTHTRYRFTVAHELCHTFFYEIVPELKFGSCEADPEEERLCNLGAAELLMPEKSLRRCARGYSHSIDSLEALAAVYAVSPEAMLWRLRALGLWRCELSYWRRRQNGFVLDRVVGGRKVSWEWPDCDVLQRAWECDRKLTGRTYLELRAPEGGRQLRFVHFQVVRRGAALVALWNGRAFPEEKACLPLFESMNKTREYRLERPNERSAQHQSRLANENASRGRA